MSKPHAIKDGQALPPWEDDYGTGAPAGLPQVAVELKCLALSMHRVKRHKYPGLLLPHQHAMNAARLQWEPEVFNLEAWCEATQMMHENTFSMALFEGFFEDNPALHVKGTASSTKTYTISAAAILLFQAMSSGVTILLSTTSGQGAELRMWDAIKTLHNSAAYRIGEILDYEKALTVDPEMLKTGKRDKSQMQIKNGILIKRLPRGKEGMQAASELVGTKNDYVVWIIDEFPYLHPAITKRPMANFRQGNPRAKLVTLGNAEQGSNPHRKACEPVGGYRGHDAYNLYYGSEGLCIGGTWFNAEGQRVLFLSGLHSPNMHPEILRAWKEGRLTVPEQLPWERISNVFGLMETVKELGHGDWRKAIKAPEFRTFVLGNYDEGGERDLTVLSPQTVHVYAGYGVTWGPSPLKKVAALDAAFTERGDETVLFLGTVGKEHGSGKSILFVEEAIVLTGQSGKDYVESVAQQAVAALRRHGVQPSGFGLDIGNDGAVMLQEISKAWGVNAHEIHAVSSIGRPTGRALSVRGGRPADEMYDRQVTEYYMAAGAAVTMGCVRGFDATSRYAEDLFERIYRRVGKGMASVEPKREMKKRIGRSPDHGDGFVYLVEVGRRNGLSIDPAPAIAVAGVADLIDNTRSGPRRRSDAGEDAFLESDWDRHALIEV